MQRRGTRMPGWTWIASLLVTTGAVVAGCAAWDAPVPSGRPVEQVYGSDVHPSVVLQSESPAASPERTRPVIYPPKVFAIYVPEHLDSERDLKIGAHWIYCKLRDSSWVEEPIDRELSGGEPVDAEDVARLRDLMPGKALAQIVVPYRSAGTDDEKRGQSEDERR